MAHTAQITAQITALKRKRTSMKAACTRIKTYVDTITELTPALIANLEERKEKLSDYWSEYNNIQFELESLCDDEGDDRITFENMYFDLTANVRRKISEYNNLDNNRAITMSQRAQSVSPVTNTTSIYNVRLPKLDLPKFSGRYEDWFPFHEMFKSVINENQSLSDFQRFQYLRASITGDAADVINALELSDQNYNVAWNLLIERYNNKRAIVQVHLRALFELPNLTKENAIDLRRLSDGAAKHIQALNTLKCPTDQWDVMLIYLITSKIDSITAREWQASLKGTELPTFKQFSEFLNHRCQLLESVNKVNAISQVHGRRAMVHVASVKSSCNYCNGDHLIYYCREFLKLSNYQRVTEARKRKLCTNCLRLTKHSPDKCNSGACKTCGKKHNSLLHLSPKSGGSPENSSNNTEKSKQETPVHTLSQERTVMTHSTTSYNTSYNSCVLLSTAVVYVVDGYGNKQLCRILLDSGSQANFITQSCVNRLQLKSYLSNIKIAGINGMTSNANKMVTIKLQSRLNGFTSIIECILTDRITERLPNAPINREKIIIPHNIKLADPEFHRCTDIDILIGVDLFWQLFCIGRLDPCQNHPSLQKTHLGWILAGRLDNNIINFNNNEVKTFHQLVIVNEDLQNQVAKFWQVEEDFHTRRNYSLVEQICEQHFIDNVSRDQQGRIIVKLPIIEDKLRTLGDTRDIALRRLYSLEKRLSRDSNLRLQYTQFMQEYLSLGHMNQINDEDKRDNNLAIYYMPHHCVLKSRVSTSETTKLRVVFDASCKSNTGISLNDVLRVGPIVQQDLLSIILRFRTFKFVFTADITKMYRQIRIHSTQTRLQRILWREDVNQDVRTYELNTVTYGTSAAPFLATRTLAYLAEIYALDFPTGSLHVKRDFYVDDLLTGADTIEDTITVRDEIINLLNQGQFVLNQWSSNDARIVHDIYKKNNASDVQIDKDISSRILGILWNPSMDIFRFSIESQTISHTITKRDILSEISRLFDPLGLIGPVIIISKMIMQEIWQLKLHWDESVPLNIHTKWLNFKEQLNELNNLNIPRCVRVHNKYFTFQLHGFCDASQRAYGACIYIRNQTADNEFQVKLLCSKTRVAPLKTISLPRLELCAAVLLAQLLNKVRTSIDLSTTKIILWSDSTIALHWISSDSRNWSVFVANRVGEIQRLTDQTDWRHVPSSENPADLLSRGVSPHDIVHSVLWWHGPGFLKNDESLWPTNSSHTVNFEMPELRKVVATAVRTTIVNPFVELIYKFSNLKKICRIVAYCLRFLRRHYKTSSQTDLCVSHGEISSVMNILCKSVQQDNFADEIRQMKRGAPLNSGSLNSLSPFLDDQQLIRVGGRLKNSQLSYDNRHPILLPKNHRLTKLIIVQEHINSLHAGLQGTIAAVRQKFWPCAIRSVARKIIRQCITCFKCKPLFSEAKMGMLPSPRVTPSRPFSNCGVDFAGPLTLRESKRRNARNSKAYICIFVCFATKAIHIELVSDLSSDSFLASLKRFISRRGAPTNIYSDNGTNFKGASRQLSELYETYNAKETQLKLKQFCCDSEISWSFIPPNAPHFGGLWEAAVKSAKYHLQRIVGSAHLTFEELYTVLCEIEAILNSRPLIPLSSDPNDLNYLTPGHFLVGNTLSGFPCRDLTDINENRLIHWQRVEQLRQHFWNRWSHEYLNQLQQRHKWTINKGEQLNPGQVVLIKQQGLPPLHWIMGRVKDIHLGSDNVARSATINTTKGIIIRPRELL